MKRKIIQQLKLWKDNPARKPLILLGARQVGKTWVMKHFGQTEFENVAYINCDVEPLAKELFAADYNIPRILLALQAITGTKIEAGKTLIVFDELQEVERGLHSLKYFQENDQLIEAQRIAERTNFDIEMMRETGFCSGIENYSRHLAGLAPGQPPNTLMDYFPDDFIIMIDESHKTVPQIGGMYHGDQSRKRTLVEYGFRLPSALDNRPLSFEEFENKIDQVMFVSATPGKYEEEHELLRAEQVIRPTGLLDPEVEVRPVEGQIDDLIGEVNKEIANKHKILITTLTKRMAEDLTDYMRELGIRVRYLHSDIDTPVSYTHLTLPTNSLV